MIPALFHGLCDDAAVFPPGNAPLPRALREHARHRGAPYRDLVGPFVLPISRLPELAGTLDTAIEVSLTAPDGPETVNDALVFVESAVPSATVTALEVALPQGTDLTVLRSIDTNIDVYIEIPRDHRKNTVLDAVAEAGWKAKFRTGGVTASAYPDEHELAVAIRAAADRHVAFKATAGLHHAIRNTDPDNGFEQHGYLNVLLAAQGASAGATLGDLEMLLAMRDAQAVADQVSALNGLRRFLSFGTCSILEPLGDLTMLGLIEPLTEGVRQ